MNEEDLLKRSAEEREKIFKRYEQGREGAEIDPWEDPGFEVYHATDRYGFIHDKRLPSKVDPQEAKRQQIELERQKKWIKMLKDWNKVLREKLHSRIYKGIPNSMRSSAWEKLLNIEQIREENKGVYEKMRKLARKYSTDARQIDSDVNRQFRDHMMYRERYCVKQQSLFNVLTAYAMYNSEVGYCQGMSGVAGVLLMYLVNDEDAFWALHLLLTDPRYAMHGLYKEGFPKLTRYLAHHDKILTKLLPKLKKHFDKHGLDAILYSLKWFFVCFIERVPFSLCLRIWDVYLLDGERVIVAMAYTILKMHRRNLLKLNDMDSIVHYIQVKLYKDFLYDDDTVVKQLENSMEELKKLKLDYPGPPIGDELPTRPFGVFKEPTFEELVGFRADKFTEKEKTMQEIVTVTSDQARESTDKDKESHLSVGDSIGFTGSKFSFDAGMDDASSLLDCEHTSSRRSLADTSVTSTADLSVFSTVTRSHHHENSLDTHSNMSDNSVGGGSSVGSGMANVPKPSISTQSTPRATPHNPSPDVLRIYVPYSPLDSSIASVPYSPLETPTASPQNGDLAHLGQFPGDYGHMSHLTGNLGHLGQVKEDMGHRRHLSDGIGQGRDFKAVVHFTDLQTMKDTNNFEERKVENVQRIYPSSFPDMNKIRIKIDNDDIPTPLVEHGQIKHFRLESPSEIDLK